MADILTCFIAGKAQVKNTNEGTNNNRMIYFLEGYCESTPRGV